jgi:glutamate synthase domain-containing protein 1/glutamate synthase domain-containing protein 3
MNGNHTDKRKGFKLKMNLKNNKIINNMLLSRGKLPRFEAPLQKCDEEGGCGVTGFISSIPIKGRHIYEPSVQMHNRGNGKGGGIAAVGLSAEDVGVPKEILEDHYLVQIAYLDHQSVKKVESTNISNVFEVYKARKIPTIENYQDIGLEVRPPDVWQYFVRVKPDNLKQFIKANNLQAMEPRKAEDEFVFQNSINLNHKYYASLGEKKAFVLSHGRNIMILKIVGYAEQVAQYYCLEDFKAHGWIAHQRYPTRGRLWHPGGAHPFTGMHEALVHNGDFANYHSVSEYLSQYNIFPQFLTDTETSVLLLDLYNRVFHYPLEYIIEALAPTTEYDFDCLPAEKQHVYRYIQSQHMAGSPDGPWFFIIARNDPYKDLLQLIGITDTAMLRPQVFALQERDEVQIGLVCSEKQAIDATLQSISKEDPRFCPIADKYWNARGGSSTDGGAFTFTLKDSGKGDGSKVLITENKFGEIVKTPAGQIHFDTTSVLSESTEHVKLSEDIRKLFESNEIQRLKQFCISEIRDYDFNSVKYLCEKIILQAKENDIKKAAAIDVLTHINDRIFSTGNKKRSSLLQIIRDSLACIFQSTPKIDDNADSMYAYIDFPTRNDLRSPGKNEKILIVNAEEFQPEGIDCDCRMINEAYRLGWKQYILYGYKGQRFTGCGFGKNTDDVRIDVYDSSGDYLASGIDGMQIYVHGNAQDQIGQIMKRGKLVVFGDVGQAFMYGAKGGNVYVMGNAAGRPLINATGQPRVVINGTCLDYLAESFMAGDPLNGGGFVVLNGIEFDDNGKVIELEIPYPGSSLFSLASGGAIYMRDPECKVVDEHLNGGEFVQMSEDDWELILPYLKENEKLFGISINEDLLSIKGQKMHFSKVYRKVQAVETAKLGKSTD